MGSCMSRKASRSTFDCVRVIHMNGCVEDYEAPVTAGEVTGKPPRHVLLSSAHLLAFGSNPLRPDDRLEPGRLYFLLPHSVFQSESSPLDLATLMARLAAAASSKRGSGSAPSAPPTALGRGGPSMASSRARTWRPELDPIEERSLSRSVGWDSVDSSVRSRVAAEA